MHGENMKLNFTRKIFEISWTRHSPSHFAY